MSDEKNKNSNEPITLGLKIVIYLGVVSGIFIGSWEIVNNIPKYEYISFGKELLVFDKRNGNLYKRPENFGEKIVEDEITNFKLVGKIEK